MKLGFMQRWWFCDVEEVDVEVGVENYEEKDTIEGLQIPNKDSNEREGKIIKIKNPKSFRKPNGVIKIPKARNTERTSILFEKYFEKE